jgi:nucleotide-binding universal stress UspA family protein
MQFFKKILFPVDLSHISPKIAPYVRELAKMFEAKVHLLFVARVFEHLTSAHLPNLTIDNLETEIAREAWEKADRTDSFWECRRPDCQKFACSRPYYRSLR